MKRLAITTCIAMAISISQKGICQEQKEKVKENKVKTVAHGGTEEMPFTATYSSKFTIGSQALAGKVLRAWKDFETNNVDDMSELFADSVTVITSDGHVFQGKDAFITAFKQYRSTLSSVHSDVQAWLPFYSTDRKTDGVLIWGIDTDTHSDGTSTKNGVHETWLFGKDGKVVFVRGYVSKEPAM